MMDGWHRGGWMIGWGWAWMLLVLILSLLLVIFLVTLLTRGTGGQRGPSAPPAPTAPRRDEALELLRRRFAAGEIDEAEFRSRRAALEGDGTSSATP